MALVSTANEGQGLNVSYFNVVTMDPSALTIIDLRERTGLQTAYANFPVTTVNDHVVKVSIMTQDFYWHYHPNSDETFLVLEGVLLIDLEATTVELQAGQLFTIPKQVLHRTRPKGKRSVNLTVESQQIETINVQR